METRCFIKKYMGGYYSNDICAKGYGTTKRMEPQSIIIKQERYNSCFNFINASYYSTKRMDA